jgi:hypothetical protein
VVFRSFASAHDDGDLPDLAAVTPEKQSKIKETDMAKGQMKSNKEAKKPKKAVAEKSAGKGIVDVFAKAKGGKK